MDNYCKKLLKELRHQRAIFDKHMSDTYGISCIITDDDDLLAIALGRYLNTLKSFNEFNEKKIVKENESYESDSVRN